LRGALRVVQQRNDRDEQASRLQAEEALSIARTRT
jgi:hypothetical protein